MDYSIYKAYDIRGVFPTEINEEAVYQAAQAYAKFLSPKKVALGRDVRLSGPKLWEAAKNGLIDHGVDVVDVGVISTDMLYFAVAHYGFDGGITISASHNPAEYNGMKLVRENSIPISEDTGLKEMQEIAKSGYSYKNEEPGKVSYQDIQADYLQKCLSVIDSTKLKKFKIVANGMFGPAIQNIMKMNLPMDFIFLNGEPDGSFPKGRPDPTLEENRLESIETVIREKADFGVSWDGDADRFFLFDENGRFIPGYYLTAFLGKYFANKNKGSKIICDPRLTWAVLDDVASAGGMTLINKSGHSFIKDRMRKEDAVFGGEMSGHYYFKDYFYCDNGLIPFLVLLEIFSESGQKVSELFERYFVLYPISGEINIKLEGDSDIKEILNDFEKKYKDAAKTEKVDGLSVEYPDWRANVRSSNTEPLIRLNVEAKNDKILKTQTKEVLGLIQK